MTTAAKRLELSILPSVIAIIVTVYINIQIAKEYLRVDGKTKALFGIITQAYKSHIAVPGIAVNLRDKIGIIQILYPEQCNWIV